MAYTEKFDLARKLVRVLITGPGNDQNAALESIRNVRLNPLFQSDFGILVDIRTAQFVQTNRDSNGVGLVLSRMFPGQKIAYVAADPSMELLRETRKYALLHVDLQIFTDIEKAEAWLCGSKGRSLAGDFTQAASNA